MSNRKPAVVRERPGSDDQAPSKAIVTYPLLLSACAFGLGILASIFFQPALWLPATLSVLASIVTLFKLEKRRFGIATAGVLFAMALLGWAFATIENSPPPRNQVRSLIDDGVIGPNDPIDLTGVLEGEPELAPERRFLTVKVTTMRMRDTTFPASGEVILQAHVGRKSDADHLDALDLHHGTQLRLMTRLERADSFRNPGVTSFTEYLDRKGYDADGLIKSPLLIERLGDEQVFLPLAWLYQWRAKIQGAINAQFSSETAGVLDAALLGNRYFLSQSTSGRFREGGTFHVLVISGLHITFLGGVVFLIARRFTRKRVIQFLASAAVLWAYTVAVGAEASVVRAALMFTIIVLAPLLSRQANSRNALGASALVLLAWNPHDLFDPSFQLTFASVAAIVLLSWPLLEKLAAVGNWRPRRETPYPPSCAEWLRTFCEAIFWSEKKWREELAESNHTCRLLKSPVAGVLERVHLQRPLRYAVSTLVVSCGVQLVLLPLLILYFHRLSLASLLLNVGVSLLMAATVVAAVFALLVSLLSVTLAGPLISLTNGLNWLLVHSVDPFARAGIASLRLPEYSGWAAALYVCYFIPLATLVWSAWRWRPLSRPISKKSATRRMVLIWALFWQCVVIGLVVFHPLSAPEPDRKLHLDFLDVGQGDSALITMPDGTTLLVDGGGKPGPFRSEKGVNSDDDKFERDTRSIGEAVVSEFLWQRGISRVDYILATHADADHIDGLNDIARNFQVRSAIVARAPQNDPEYTRFAGTLAERRIPLYEIGARDELRFGDVTVSVLWPPPAAGLRLPSQNNDSIVLRVAFGRRAFLLTGDIEEPGEGALLQTNENIHCDVVKVAHHGSKTSSTANFIAAAQPGYAVISVGQTSIFGHPNPDVVKRWQAAGATVLRTGNSGTITFSTDGDDLRVETFVKPK